MATVSPVKFGFEVVLVIGISNCTVKQVALLTDMEDDMILGMGVIESRLEEDYIIGNVERECTGMDWKSYPYLTYEQDLFSTLLVKEGTY